MFDSKQLALLNKLDLTFKPIPPLTDSQLDELEDKVGDYLIRHCFDEDYNPLPMADVCYSILDNIDSW